MPRLPTEVIKDILTGASQHAAANAALSGLATGGASAMMAPEGERGEEFLHGLGRGAAWGAATGALSGGLSSGLGGRSPTVMDAWTSGIRGETGALAAFKNLTPQQKAAIIGSSALEAVGGGAQAIDELRRMKKEGGVMLETWLSKLAESEMSKRDRERGLNGMTLDELDALLAEKVAAAKKREKTADLGATLVERGATEKVADYSPELMQQLQNPEIQQAFRQSGAVLDPALMPVEPRHVMAVAPTMEEHVAKQREEGGRAMGGLATIPGSALGAIGGGAAAHGLHNLIARRGANVGELLAKTHNIPLELAGAAGGALLGGIGGYHAGKPVGALLSGRQAAKDSPEIIQQTANVDLANKLYRQGLISKNEMVGAESRYDQAVDSASGIEPELPKTSSLQQFAAKLAACSKTVKKSALKKVSGGQEFSGADSIKTANLKDWVGNRLVEIDKNAGFFDRAAALIGGVAKKAAPVAEQAAKKAVPAEEIATRAAQHAKEMEGMRATARVHRGGGPGSMLTSAPPVEHMGAGRRSAMLR